MILFAGSRKAFTCERMSRPRNPRKSQIMKTPLTINRSIINALRYRERFSDGAWIAFGCFPISEIKSAMKKEGFSFRDLRDILDENFPRVFADNAGEPFARRPSYFVRRVYGVRCLIVSQSGGFDI